ncbi:hypothetical protein scyTo_0018378 [Scyliorhinus torazame]|uniref:Uncharacterized protein n=1 Tax=Scyliorhinus torazame TaxID=75743 RepID=A0A401PUE7_SCYTO|nr:hypothetical protein [Scyliorhinus torazame]
MTSISLATRWENPSNELATIVPGYEHVNVMVNLTSLHLPAYCYGQGLFVALEREILDGSGLAPRKRRQRGIVELAVGGYGAGVSTVNALDIAEISVEIEVMKRQMRAAVKNIYQDAETATDLSQHVNQLVWRELKQLQPYQTTINELIDRQSAISKEVCRVQACNMYATYLLQSLHANLLQLAAHRVPDWMSNDQMMAWVKTAHQAPEHRRELTLTSRVPFANDNHTLIVGMVLHIPRAGENSTHELLQVSNLGHYGNGVLVKLKDAPPHAIQRAGVIFSIDFRICKGGEGNNWLYPERAISTEDYCGYTTYENCTLAVELTNQTVFNHAQYLDNYYSVTAYHNYTKHGIVCELPGHNVIPTNLPESITIGRHVLTPYRDVSIVEADDRERTDDDQQADDRERTDDDQQIHRYVQKGLPRIPHLRADWEGLKKEATQIDHLWSKERELIQTHAEKATELFQSQNFFSKVWNWELNTNIHPWICIISHVVILQLFILLVFFIMLCCFRRRIREW